MKKFGIIGNPVAGSLSPALFRAAYGGQWAYDLIEEPDFASAWKRFIAEYQGINITAPFKAEACAEADEAAETASRIGAANLAVKTARGIEVHNTDFSGVVLSIAGALVPGLPLPEQADEAFLQRVRPCLTDLYPSPPSALVIGAGGAGRAAAVAAAEMGFRVTLMNRTHPRALQMAEELPAYPFEVRPVSALREAFRASDAVLYTAPAALEGLAGLSAEDCAGEDPYGRPAKVLLEANYKSPVFSGPLRERFEAGGGQYLSGRRWLLHQAGAGYGIFTGAKPDFAAMAQVLL